MDHRDSLNLLGNGRGEFDRRAMTITLDIEGEDADGDFTETITVPARFEVCPSCQGRGSYVNPSIDAHGLSREDFDEDPDFAESYFSGQYDVECRDCNGARVVPVPDESNLTPAVLKSIEDHEYAQLCHRQERAAELRYGC